LERTVPDATVRLRKMTRCNANWSSVGPKWRPCKHIRQQAKRATNILKYYCSMRLLKLVLYLMVKPRHRNLTLLATESPVAMQACSWPDEPFPQSWRILQAMFHCRGRFNMSASQSEPWWDRRLKIRKGRWELVAMQKLWINVYVPPRASLGRTDLLASPLLKSPLFI
jgi:hypothetical protein